jgi:MGT family glycosyltransferase
VARILIGTFSVIGHVTPFLPLARGLVARGHDVIWITSATFQERIEATGARFAAPIHAQDRSNFNRADIAADGEKLEGMAALKADLKNVFIDGSIGQLRDLELITRSFSPDVLLIDPGFVGGAFFYECTGVPTAVLNILPLSLSSPETAPNGLGMAPSSSSLGRLRNRSLQWMIETVVFRDVQQHWNATRSRLGLPKTGWLFDTLLTAPLVMQASIPGFEYPRSNLPPQVHFIGRLPAEAPRNWTPSAWWHELDGAKPIVHVTQGTIANTSPRLIGPTLAGLAGEDLLVVVSTGGAQPDQIGIQELPANARLSTFLSYPDLLPRTAAMVTNGGYGGTQMALSNGVPLAVAGTTEDKPEVAARVAWSGTGINLKTAAPTPRKVRDAVRALLDDARYRRRAQALQAEYARYDAVKIGVDLVERLAASGKPILRSEVTHAPHEGGLVPATAR